jgi:hypothetical protein
MIVVVFRSFPMTHDPIAKGRVLRISRISDISELIDFYHKDISNLDGIRGGDR